MSTDSNVVTPTTFYGYVPTKWTCILFLLFFNVIAHVHIWQAVFRKPRTLWVLHTIAMSGFVELMGWSGRFWNARTPLVRPPFVIQEIACLVAPLLLTAGLQIIVAKLVNIFGSEYSRLTPKTYFRIFIALDVVCFFVQAAGAGIATATTKSSLTSLGTKLMLVGVILHLVTLLLSVALGIEAIACAYKKTPIAEKVHSHSTIELEPTSGTDNSREVSSNAHRMVIGWSIATVLVIIRLGYRIVALIGGYNGHIMRTEVYFNALDGAPILVALTVLCILTPTTLLRTTA